MATYIPAPTAMDPLGLALGQGLGQGLAGWFINRNNRSDFESLMDYLNNMETAQRVPGSAVNAATQAASQAAAAAAGFPGGIMGPVVPQDLSGMVPTPDLRGQRYRDMLLQMRLGQILNPVEKAQIGGIEAQAMRDRAAALATLNPPAKPTAGRPFRVKENNEYGLPAGSVIQFDANNDMKILWQPATSVDAERAKRIRELRSVGGPLTQDQQAELNAMLVPGGGGMGPTRDDAGFYTSRGFTSEEASDILGIRYGVKPRAGATASPEADLNRMLSIYIKSSFDPIWGQDIPELAGVKSLAQRRINELTAQARNGPDAKPMAQGDMVREILNLKVGNTRIVERVPTGRLFHDYPVLTSQLPTLNQEELDGVLSAIESGMTEAEILRFFTDAGGVTAPAGVQ